MGRYDDDLVGADEIIGDDEDTLLAEIMGEEGDDYGGAIGADEIIGRVSPAIRKRIMLRRAKLIKSRQFDRLRKYLLGVQQLAVGAGVQATINSQPQYPFRPYRYMIPATFAPNFVVDALSIGQQPVFVAAGAVPAEVFSEVAVGGSVLWDTASIGNQVSVQVTNISAGNADFRSALFGVVGKD